jgi:cytochrome P450
MHKLQDEVRSTFATIDDISLASVNALSYQNNVIMESLRLCPPGPETVRRRAMTGKVISGQYVPEGTLVGVYHWVAGRYSRAWRNADSFIPERWLPNSNEYSEDWRNVIQPYQVGPRNCAGQVLANAELRLILAAMIVSFDMSLADEEQKDWLDFPIFGLMSDKKPLMVKLRPVS